MSAETRIVNEKTGGEKGRKAQRFELLPQGALARIAEVYGFGAEKYEEHNWRRGYDWSLSYGALQRHLTAWWEGEECDPESGLSHLAHAGFHVLALLTFIEEHPDLDDRYASVRAARAVVERERDEGLTVTDLAGGPCPLKLRHCDTCRQVASLKLRDRLAKPGHIATAAELRLARELGVTVEGR